MPSADIEKAAERGGDRPVPEQRAELHRRQAVHRARRRGRRVRAPVRRAAWRRCSVGDPLDDATEIGPLATEQGRDDVEELVDDAVAKGATRRSAAANVSTAPAGMYPPTVVTGVTDDMRVLQRGGVRPRRRALPSVRHRRGDRHRQRHRLRARIERLDQRPRRAGALHRRTRRRRGVHQRHDDLVSRAAVRRREGVGLRARARRCRASARSATSRPSGWPRGGRWRTG